MSYERRGHGGGGRRRHHYNRDDYDERRREPPESPDDKIKNSIIRFGEVDAVEELPRLVKEIREQETLNLANLAEAFRIGVTEEPFKTPHYAALLRALYEQREDEPILGRQILEEFWKGFQSYLDRLSWRETRLCIHFFAHLTSAKLISPESMIALLQSFTAVLDEFGVSHARAKKAAFCAGDGLIMAGPVLKAYSASSVSDIITALHTFSDTTGSQKWLVAPTTKATIPTSAYDNSDELLDTLLSALGSLNESDFAETDNCFPKPYRRFEADDSTLVEPYSLPSVLVPPEVIELDSLSSDSGEEAQVKKEEWPEFTLRLFNPDVSPNPHSPAGYIIRTALLDIIDIFEVNRKECARLLLEYPKWNLPGTFKPKPGATVEIEPLPGKDWQLESTVLETLLGAYFLLPESSQKSIYYIGLVTELCKLSPSTVGPAVGKSVRKIYSFLSEGLDVEVARRFAEWFAVHMSNFGFQWVWKEWVPDLALTVQHPRRAFMRRAIEFEMRLSYHDRILKTLPEAMQSPDAYTISGTAPSPDFEYDDPSHPHYDASQSILDLFRGRAKADDVVSHLDTLKTTLEASEEGHVNVESVTRRIAVQSLLNIGSRSFSHLLNAIERYLPLLRNLAGINTSVPVSSSNSEAKADILSAAAAFWKHNRQMVGIVFDKLMQYQIVDPTDVVGWTFLNGAQIGQLTELAGPMNLSAFEWDLLKGALDKANGRVMIARRKVTALRKEDDDTRARAKAGAGESMEVDADANIEEMVVDNPALTTALKAFSSLTREQKAALSKTLDGFVASLAPLPTDHHPNPHSRTVIAEGAWENRDHWGRDEWNAWETWGWYRQFCRAYSPYLRTYSNTLYTVAFARYDGSDDPAAELLKKIWNVATGQDA